MSMNSTSKYDRGNGIHGVPMWRMAGFALNNTSTNLYMFFMGYIAYYLIGWIGLATVFASSFSTIMRLWDGVTDPFIGYLVDKTNGKFGKNRPFMIIGNVILAVTSFIMFFVAYKLPEGPIRIVFFFAVAAVYYIGYTFQCVVTKSAQSCITNDPKQRPWFAVFDATYNTFLFVGLAIFAADLSEKYGGFTENVKLYQDFWLFTFIASAVCCLIAVISITPKDRPEYFGTGKAVRIGFKDYWDVLKNNRAIQMLVVSASTDKLASTAKTSAVTVVMYGVIVGNYKLNAGFSMYTSIVTLIFVFVGLGYFTGRLGQRKAMIIGSLGSIICCALLCFLWIFGDPATFNLPGYEGFTGITFFTVALIVLSCLQGGFGAVSGNIVIPMTADCADYEVYRSGRYVPGLMGTLFSFVDKMISSLAPLIAGLLFSAIGFKDALPDVNTPYSDSLLYVGVFLSYGLLIIGLLCNLVAMKFYPLTKEKMADIQEEIAAIKAKAMKG